MNAGIPFIFAPTMTDGAQESGPNVKTKLLQKPIAVNKFPTPDTGVHTRHGKLLNHARAAMCRLATEPCKRIQLAAVRGALCLLSWVCGGLRPLRQLMNPSEIGSTAYKASIASMC